MNIAIFGGSFNPVHCGHYEIVRQTFIHCDISKVIVVPVYQNPLKDGTPSLPEWLREKMLCVTFSGFNNVEISSFELLSRKVSYTYKTLLYYKQLYRSHQLYLIVGEDAFASIHLWAKTDRISGLADILVFARSGMSMRNRGSFANGSLNRVTWINSEIPDISATKIRNSSLSTIKKNSWLHPEAFKLWKSFVMENK